MGRRGVSIEDIARAAGVSHSTVSRALRDNPLISADVRAQIRQLADDLGYVPNAIAQSLQTQRSGTVGLVVPTISDPFLFDVVKGVEDIAQEAGLSVFLSASHNDAEREIAVIETFHRRRVDGLLIADSQLGSRYAERLARIHAPAVLLNSQAETRRDGLHSIAVDDDAGARLAVGHLLDLGHRAIGYLGVGNRPRSNRRRREGYRDALASAGIAPDPAWVVTAPAEAASHEEDVATGQALLPELLGRGVSAIFCYNDMTAVGALLACRELGVVVPESLSIVGFDDIVVASYVSPPLTTVRQPTLELGRRAMGMLRSLMAEDAVRDETLMPALVRRGSTAPPA